MGWQDDPVVGGGAPSAGWQGDPVVAPARKTMPPAIEQQVPLIAVGHTIDRLAAGLKQGVRGVFGDRVVGGIDALGSALGMADSSNLESSQAGNEVEYDKLRKAFPVQTFVGEAGAGMAGKTPAGMAALAALEYGTPKERAIRGGVTYGAGKLGEYVAGKVGDALVGRAGRSTNPVRDATVREMQAEGLKLPPSQVNQEAPGVVNRVLEGMSGKIQTAQAAAIKNQPKVNAIAARELGLPPNTPLTGEVLNAVRSEAGKAYAAVKQTGTVAVDDDFGKAIGESIGPYLELKGQFPSQTNAKVDDLIKDIAQPQMEASSIVNLVKRLRYNGFKNVKAQDPATAELGRVEIATQNALEDLLDRHLAKTGQQQLLQDYRAARTLIAKTHTVENALEESTGNVVASKIGKEFSKGRPLTGGLATIGKAGEAFPRAVQNVNSSMPGLSPLDMGVASITGAAATGNPLGAGIPFLRPLVREAILSAPYQRAMASPVTGSTGLFGAQLEGPQAMLLRQLMERGGGLLGSSAALYGQ